MDPRTARALAAINLAFYRERAEEFGAAREGPWPGWTGLLEILRRRGSAAAATVLDVGCGNGRFGAFLRDAGLPAHRYLGIDASPELLAQARARALPGARYEGVDLVASDPETSLPKGPFALVTLFGVLHHVPGRARRRALLGSLLRRVERGGLLALAVWQIGAGDRHQARVVAWDEWNRRAAEPLDLAELEPGDCLLAWGAAHDAVRYCHFTDDAELAELLDALPCTRVGSWYADGREGCRNRYLALEPAAASR